MISLIFQAVGLFVVTNIDDIIVLALFFARGAGRPRLGRRIALGQYLGFGGILAVTLATVWGAGTFLPSELIPYFGLIPLAIGIKAGWDAWRGADDDEVNPSRKVSVATVAAVTFANGGDNIGVYVPVFLGMSARDISVCSAVFLLLVGILVWVAGLIAHQPQIHEFLEKTEHVVFPLVLVILGIVILVEGGAFGF